MEDDKVIEESRRLPMEDRVVHTSWKARVAAYEDMDAACRRSRGADDPAILEYARLLASKGVVDSNAAAQLKALESLVALLDVADENVAARVAKDIASGVMDKVLAGRPPNVLKGTEVCMLLVELGQAATVVEQCVRTFKHRTPKVTIGALNIALNAVTLFGVPTVPPKPLIQALPPIFDAKNAHIRDGAKQLTLELSKWVGADAMRSTLMEKMRDAMKRDVEEWLSQVPAGRPEPERLTRREAAARAAAEGLGGEGDDVDMEGEMTVEPTAGAANAVAPPAEMDPYDLADPVDVLSKIGDAWTKRLASKKWAERKEALSELAQAASAPRLAPGDFMDVARELKRIIAKDSNVNCVAEALRALAALACGLRRDFGTYARMVAPDVLAKLKDKKAAVVEACMGFLKAAGQHCLGVDVIGELAAQAISDKSPGVRKGALEWVDHVVSLPAKSKAEVSRLHPALLPAVTSAIQDADPAVREAAIGAIGAFASRAGSLAPFSKHLGSLDDAKRRLLEERIGASPQEAEAGAMQATVQAPAKPSGVTMRLGTRSQPAAVPQRRAAPANVAAKVATRSGARGVGEGRTNKAAGPPGTAAPQVWSSPAGGPAMSEEEAVAALGNSGCAPGALAGLKSASWRDRMEAAEALRDALSSGAVPGAAAAVALSGVLSREKNAQAGAAIIEAIGAAAGNPDGGVGAAEARAAAGAVAEKIGEAKCARAAGEALSSLCEAAGTAVVSAAVRKCCEGAKSPKTRAEGLAWAGKALREFGAAQMDVAAVVGWAMAELEAANAQVRSSAVALLGEAHRVVGGRVRAMLGTVKPALMSIIDAELDKSPHDLSAPATRHVRGSTAAGQAPAPAIGGSAGRVDVSGRVTEDLLAQLANTKWAQRQAALQEVSAMLASTGNCIGADVGELVPALKARLADSNKNLVVQAIEVSAQLATAMGKAFQKEGKALLEASLLSLSDRRPQARAAVVAMLEACAAACGPDWVVHDVRAAVGSPRCSGEGRQTALLFLSNAVRQYAASLSPGSLADVLLVAHLGQADRTAEAREGAAALLAAVAEAVAPAAVASALPALRCPDPVAARAGIEAALSRAGIDVPQLRPGHSSHPSAPHPSSSAAAPNARGPARAGPPAAALRRSTTAVTRPATGVQRGTAALRVSASARLVGSSKAPAGAAAEDAFLTADSGKATRARRMRVVRVPVKWDDPRPEEHDELKAELAGVAGPALLGEMFSRDFRKHCSAAERIKAAASGAEHERVVGSLDLVLQWAALRVCESNTQSLVKVLEMVSAIVDSLAARGEGLSDQEALALLPTLVEKAGHNLDRVKAMHTALVRSVAAVYPGDKVMEYVGRGLESANKRTRVVWMDDIARQVEESGGVPVQVAKAKVLPLVAKNVGEKDNSVRNAAVRCAAAVWRFAGQKAWSLLGKPEGQIAAFLEDKFKRTPVETPDVEMEEPSKPSNATFAGGAVRQAPPQDLDVSMADARVSPPRLPGGGFVAAPAAPPSQAHAFRAPTPQPDVVSAPAPSAPAPTAQWPQRPVPVEVSAAAAHLRRMSELPPTPMLGNRGGDAQMQAKRDAWAEGVEMTTCGDIGRSVEGMKVLCTVLLESTNAKGPLQEALVSLFALDADRLAATLASSLEMAFRAAVSGTPSDAQAGVRLAKYTLNTLMQLFNFATVAECVSEPTLRALVGVTLNVLPDPRLQHVDDGPALVRALNLLVIRVISNCAKAPTIAIFLDMLLSPPVLPSSPQGTEEEIVKLVVKCMVKITKALGQLLPVLDIGAVLLSIHSFFVTLGNAEIKRRGDVGDDGLRIVKTMLYHLCKLKGPSIREHLPALPPRVPGEEAAAIVKYVEINLQSFEATHRLEQQLVSELHRPQAGPATATAHAAHAHAPAGATPPLLPIDTNLSSQRNGPSASAETPSKAADPLARQLSAAFKKISDRRTTAQGLEDLYDLTRANPGLSLESYLGRFSDELRRYVVEGVRAVGQKRGDTSVTPARSLSRTPSKIPTPPKLDPALVSTPVFHDRADAHPAPPRASVPTVPGQPLLPQASAAGAPARDDMSASGGVSVAPVAAFGGPGGVGNGESEGGGVMDALRRRIQALRSGLATGTEKSGHAALESHPVVASEQSSLAATRAPTRVPSADASPDASSAAGQPSLPLDDDVDMGSPEVAKEPVMRRSERPSTRGAVGSSLDDLKRRLQALKAQHRT